METLYQSVYRARSRRACKEAALVLSAAGIAFQTVQSEGAYHLVVADSDAPGAVGELRAYAEENPNDSADATDVRMLTDGVAGAMLYGVVLLAVGICQDRAAFGWDWFEAGRTGAGLIREGQWWRTVTALTLHADAAHLLANWVVGTLFGLFAAQLLGAGLAWFCIVLGGAGGNLLNAWLQPVRHASVGASTAVFAALGLVAAYAWVQRRHIRGAPLSRWAPLISAVVLLAYLGVGGARTDVGAHVAGMVCGGVTGVLLGWFVTPRSVPAWVQGLLGLAAAGVIVLAWGLAVSRGG